jgi:SAM-dependent methyltransferase
MPAGAFEGTAAYYVPGRPPYSPDLRDVLGRELGLDGTGRLLDVGCGPGVLTVLLADFFADAIGLDPEPEMLEEAQRRAAAAGRADIRWIEGRAEEIGQLEVAPCRAVTFGQSFHRTERQRAAEAVYDVLEPGGAIVLVSHAVEGRPWPPSPGPPPIPHEEIGRLIQRYLGPTPERAAAERWEASLRRTRFGPPRIVFAPGVPDYVRDEDSVVANFFSISTSAPPLFGGRSAEFEADLRALLRARSPDGQFWDWPGDTEIVLGVRA